MKLIVGLGNPEEKYDLTRHNLGFWVVQFLDHENKIIRSEDSKFNARVIKVKIESEEVLLVQPLTYMNNSGESVKKIKDYYGIDNENIIVVNDDVDLPVGRFDVKSGGSSAGHKGIQSVIDTIGKNFWRVRIGIDRNSDIPTEKWVLKNLTTEEQEKYQVNKNIDIAKTGRLGIVGNVASYLEKHINNIKEETIILDFK
jgi:PTH1 family peptidyl-tRNA hydrolase